MEFLRLGSSIPGSYWGCCAVDVIQNFNLDPDEKSSIQIVDGDGGHPISNDKGMMYAGPTYRDIFWQRLRYGTFGTGDMPNHGFIAVLTSQQVAGSIGRKWLKILKEAGFEFIRTVDNSVYTGRETIEEGKRSPHPNYIFGLFRNIGAGSIPDPYTPPKEWTALESPIKGTEVWEHLKDTTDLAKKAQEAQLPLYHALPKDAFLSEEEVTKYGAPVVYAGLRSKNPQEFKYIREDRIKKDEKGGKPTAAPFLAPIPTEDFEGDEDYDEYYEEEEYYDEYGEPVPL